CFMSSPMAYLSSGVYWGGGAQHRPAPQYTPCGVWWALVGARVRIFPAENYTSTKPRAHFSVTIRGSARTFRSPLGGRRALQVTTRLRHGQQRAAWKTRTEWSSRPDLARWCSMVWRRPAGGARPFQGPCLDRRDHKQH